MRIGIDLLWVRVGICGGTESYIRTLLDGFSAYGKENNYILFVSQDNAYSFEAYQRNPHMQLCVCKVRSENQAKRILWENLYLDRAAHRCHVDVMFIPVYSKPFSSGSIPYVSVIHDLQALHYPQYFSNIKRIFLNYAWWNTCQTSAQVITISDYCKNDIIRHYPSAKDKTVTIYDAVESSDSGMDAKAIEEKYNIKRGQYFYCVSSMLPHKNLGTILKVMQKETEHLLVLSGVGGQEEAVKNSLEEYGIEDKVILTGFVSNEERDCLYENCRLFLFPSVFEGFGMPPIEAMRKGKRVVMTKKSCLQEVTQGRAVYVEHPFSVREWRKKIEAALELPEEKVPFEAYETAAVVQQYIRVLRNAAEKE